VIIGILAAIAIPKFAATKDKAKLASVQTDLRNVITAQEAYFADFATYAATPTTLVTANLLNISSGNTVASGAAAASGWTATISNTSITSGKKICTVQVGAGATSTVDGVMVCS
jgi:Tfp pilus assembly protein PilE